MARRALGDLKGAIDDFNQALRSAPPHLVPRFLRQRGLARQALGDAGNALADLSAALAAAPRNAAAPLYFDRAGIRVMMITGDYPQGVVLRGTESLLTHR